MRNSDPKAPLTTSQKIELGLAWDQKFALAAWGFLGVLPTTVWLGGISMLLFAGDSRSGSSSSSGGLVAGVLGGVAALALLVVPSLVPVLVLRARQKYRAHLVWDDEGVTDWDGVWRRASIPWSRIEAAHLVWVIPGKYSRGMNQDVLQLYDRSSNVVISAWQGAPSTAPTVRRRVVAQDLSPLIEALKKRDVPFTREIDYLLAEDPERKRMHGFSLALARLGYVGAVLGPMTALPAAIPGVAISVISAALLAWRALPVFRELRAVSVRMRGEAASSKMPSNTADPYREADAPPISKDPHGRYEADKIKRRAVLYEATLRGSFVALTLFAGCVMALQPK